MKMHKNLTAERIMDGVERQMLSLSNVGFCVACGQEDFDSDPDTRGKECESCGQRAVFGAAELLAEL